MNVSKNEDSFYRYWTKDIKIHTVPSTIENNELAVRAQSGDENAFNELLNRNKRLILNFARQRTSDESLIEELLQCGSVALYDALSSYDISRGDFVSYASMFIRKEMNKTLAVNNYGYSLKSKFYSNLCSYKKLEADSEMRGEELPSDQTLRKTLRTGQESLERLKNYKNMEVWSLNHVSENNKSNTEFLDFCGIENSQYNKVFKRDNNGTFIIDYDESLYDSSEKLDINLLLKILKARLSPYKYFLFYYSFCADKVKSYQELANIFGLSREAPRTTIKRTLDMIETFITQVNLEAYVKENNLSKIKTQPVTPKSIIQYLFVRGSLDSMEMELYKSVVLGNYEISKLEYAKYYGISVEALEEKWSNLLNKIKASTDSLEYQEFRKSILNEYGNKIYDLDLNAEIDVRPAVKSNKMV